MSDQPAFPMTAANAIRHMTALGYKTLGSDDGYDSWESDIVGKAPCDIVQHPERTGVLQGRHFFYDKLPGEHCEPLELFFCK